MRRIFPADCADFFADDADQDAKLFPAELGELRRIFPAECADFFADDADRDAKLFPAELGELRRIFPADCTEFFADDADQYAKYFPQNSGNCAEYFPQMAQIFSQIAQIGMHNYFPQSAFRSFRSYHRRAQNTLDNLGLASAFAKLWRTSLASGIWHLESGAEESRKCFPLNAQNFAEEKVL